MSDHDRAGNLDRSAAERLFDGADGHARLHDGHARLHALLSAAAAPARPEELAGEDAAVAAFKAAAPRPARTSRMAALRRFLTVKALILVGGSLILSGGAAGYAAMNGHIPGVDPAPSPTPTLDEQTSTGQHSTPVTPVTPSTASPSDPSPTARPPSKPASPGTSKKPGGEGTPGQENRTKAPAIPEPPQRGPGNNNGTPPSKKPRHENGSGNGNADNGTPPSQNPNSDNGTGRPD